MRAIIQNVPGVLRVESPPFRTAEYVTKEDGSQVIRVRIQFAFDAVRAVSEGRPTVNLTMRSRPARSYQKPLTPKSISLKEAARALDELVKSQDEGVQGAGTREGAGVQRANVIASKRFTFDLLSSIPDTSILSLKAREPVQYDYLQSLRASATAQAPESNSSLTTGREYLLSLVSNGIDPASISENFPSADPTTGKKDAHAPASFSFYTTKIPRISEISSRYILSNFLIFEQEVELTREEFASLTFYEFDYRGTAANTATQSKTSVSISSSELLTQLDSYTDSADGPVQSFYRRQDSYYAILPEAFSAENRFTNSNTPSVVRHHSSLISGESLSPRFRSSLSGRASSSNGKGSKTARQEPDVFPFFVQIDGTRKSVRVAKLPPDTKRIEVLARGMSRGQVDFQVVATTSDASLASVGIPIGLPQTNSTYELKLRVYDSRGRSITSSNTVTCGNKALYAGAQINVSAARLVGATQSSVSIGAGFTDSGRQDLTNLISQLTSAGVGADVISSISSESSLYSQIFSFRVETLALSTGEQSYSRELAPSANSPSAEFVFNSSDPLGTVLTISLGMKSPDALVPAQSGFRFGLFGGSFRKSQPSGASLERNKRSGESFNYADTGVKVTVFVPPRNQRGDLTELSASKTLRASTLIRWKYDGDINEVDHFQVLGAAGEDECLLGCSFRSLSFEDSVLSTRVGTVRYTVRPIYLDLSMGNPAVIYQETDTTLPEVLSPNFKQGARWQLVSSFAEIPRTLQQSANFLGNNLATVTSPATGLPELTLDTPRQLTLESNATTKSVRKAFLSSAPSAVNLNINSRKSGLRTQSRTSNGGK